MTGWGLSGFFGGLVVAELCQWISGGYPLFGQSYTIPTQFAGAEPGDTIMVDGYNYMVGDGQMWLAQPDGVVFGQAYAIPDGYEVTPGELLEYGPYCYLVSADGTTMTPYSYLPPDSQTDSQTVDAPLFGQLYSLPAEQAGAAVGDSITLDGYNYVVVADGQMSLVLPSDLVLGRAYAIPDGYQVKPGELLDYGAYRYLASDDGTTMTPCSYMHAPAVE